jgi:hypothetical protein
LDAARRARAEGFRALDAFTPFPVEGLPEVLQLRDQRVPALGLIGACIGFGLAVGMQILTNFDFPINVGGRPLYALSAFAVIAFELTILFAALLLAFGMLFLNGLPRLNHPVFAAPRFHLASRDRFFLCIMGDEAIATGKAARFFEGLGAKSLERVRL